MALALRKNNFFAAIILFGIISCKNETNNTNKENTETIVDSIQKENTITNYISSDNSYSLSTSNQIPKKIKGENLNFETEIEPAQNSVDLSWSILEMNFPSTWEYAFCDNTGCYLELPKENKLNIIEKKSDKETKQLKLQVNTNGISGSFALKLLLKSSPLSNDTVYFEGEY